jgi:hypothetical protein
MDRDFFLTRLYPLQDAVRERFALWAQRLIDAVAGHDGWRVDVLGRLDSAENILANKLAAVVDRREPKDLADIRGLCCRLNLSCEAALENAHSKAAGSFASRSRHEGRA